MEHTPGPNKRSVATPGPWSVYLDTEEGYVIEIRVVAEDGRTVCTFDDDFGTNQVKDARLIAGAPDLLKAAQAVMRVAASAMPPGPVFLSIEERNALRSAIAKATHDEEAENIIVDAEDDWKRMEVPK